MTMAELNAYKAEVFNKTRFLEDYGSVFFRRYNFHLIHESTPF
jgi:hypothetical protein